MRNFVSTILLLLICSAWATASAGSHPSLLLTKSGVESIKSSRGTIAAFDRSLDADIAAADRAISEGITIAEPREGGGGYSHEKHKQNYYALYNCGIAYQVTGDKKYAEFAAQMLEEYAKVYPRLGYHPITLSKTPGRLFWQTLNECVWLVHASIAYDCIYDYVDAKRRSFIEKDLLRPLAEFIMDGMGANKQNNVTFNRMHNHGTWATAAVGMAGLAMGDDSYVQKALYGSDLTGKSGGFMMQMDKLFSPDGYFTEGAYYQRYAIWPFMMFAQAIDNNKPDMNIFGYRGRILEKALDVLIQLAYNGQFMKINDAMDKGYDAQELVYAVDIIYKSNPSKKELLSVVKDYQGKFLPTDAGYVVARDISRGEAQPIEFRSVLLRDGAQGNEGGVAIIRSTNPAMNSALVMKATSHGLSHGHYDKLNLIYYNNGTAVIPDYGAARFVNIEAKYKGHYTAENKSFAMTSIAHNTVVVDGQSHYGGDMRVSSMHNPRIYLSDLEGDELQVVSAIDSTAYEGCRMQRTLFYLTTDLLECPLILDVFNIRSDKEHRYDYPLYYNGHIVSLSFDYDRSMDGMKTFGSANGYQHLWVEAQGKPHTAGTECFTWLDDGRFYSISTCVTPNAELFMVRSGANDKNFNLRSQTGYVLRENAQNHTFVTAIETHGSYGSAMELATNVAASVSNIKLLKDDNAYTVAEISFVNGKKLVFCLSLGDSRSDSGHSLTIEGKPYVWRGPYFVFSK